jgi:hypothetical protein
MGTNGKRIPHRKICINDIGQLFLININDPVMMDLLTETIGILNTTSPLDPLPIFRTKNREGKDVFSPVLKFV